MCFAKSKIQYLGCCVFVSRHAVIKCNLRALNFSCGISPDWTFLMLGMLVYAACHKAHALSFIFSDYARSILYSVLLCIDINHSGVYSHNIIMLLYFLLRKYLQ